MRASTLIAATLAAILSASATWAILSLPGQGESPDVDSLAEKRKRFFGVDLTRDLEKGQEMKPRW